MALKYRIKQLVSELPRSFDITEEVKKLGISVRTFHRDKSIEHGSKKAIDGDRLRAYATLFGCTMEELYTQPGLQAKED